MHAPRPELLREDNWTPPTRTPWGGRWIRDHLKRGLPRADAMPREGAVGESWELSLDAAFPSRLEDGRALAEVIAAEPEAWLGRHAAAGSSPMLVKLLDAREVLSVQVHPADDDPALGPSESGKPEAWIVLERQLGAGLWLGLADGVDRAWLERALERAEDLSPALNFVPVEPGDAFLIEAGTVHAVGAGVTLLEPQLVRPGRTGVTYRFWDWGRRYDEAGRLDPAGAPRPLHQARSLAVTRFEGPRGAAFVDGCRARPQTLSARAGVVHERVLTLHELAVERVAGTGGLLLEGRDTLVGVVVTRGRVEVGAISARAGQTLVVPAACAELALRLTDGECFLHHLGG